MKTRLLILSVSASFLASLHSATVTWDAGGDGVSWHDPLNWSGNVLPGPADDVSIALTGAAVVHSTGDHSVRSVISSRPLTMLGGSLTATNGLRINSSVFTLSGGTISNTVRLVGSTLNMGTAAAPGATILLNGLCSFTGVVPLGQLLWIEGRVDTGLARLTATNSFTNHGTIRLETTQNDYADRGSYLVVQNGALWNSAVGRIEANAGMGDGRSITGTVWNEGTLVAGAGATLAMAGDLTQAGGEIRGDGEFRVDGGRVDMLGGMLTGLVRAQNAAVWVAESVTAASELRVVGPNNILLGNLSPAVTLWVEGRVDYGLARLTATNEVTNLGTIHLETTQNDSWDRSSYLACGPGIINGPSGRIEAMAGAGDSRPTTGRLVNQGQVDAQTTLDFAGTLESAGGTYAGSFYVHDSSLRVTASPTTPTTLHLRGPNNQLLTDNLAGTTLWVEGRVDYDRARLTIIGTKTNHGVIHLETSQNDVWDRGSFLTVRDGILHNAADGRVEANPGEGDSRVLNGAVRNEGVIVAASNTSFSVSGNVTQAAGEIRGDGEFRMDGGLFDFVGCVLNMTSNQDRPFIYANQAAPKNGVMEMRVPYSTESRYECAAADPYLIFSGNQMGVRMKHVNVSEDDVLQGRTIEVAF